MVVGVESANPDLADPSLVVTCDGDDVVVETNSMLVYLYIEASPGDPEPSDLTFRIPLTPVVAGTPGDIPALGPSAVAINGVAIRSDRRRCVVAGRRIVRVWKSQWPDRISGSPISVGGRR